MKCSNCVLGDLQFVIRGVLTFRTDAKGRPSGTAEVKTTSGQSSLVCDTCDAVFGIAGWRDDGSGEVVLVEADDHTIEETRIELEHESPPPGMD